jgi:hypothetical protein
MSSDPHVEAAADFLRGHSRADLRFDQHFEPIKYVVAPDGRLVSPVMVAMLSAGETVLFVPEDREGCLEVMVTLEEFAEAGPRGGLADRWRIYHGEPKDVRWAAMTIDAVRFRDMFIDGEALQQANPLAGGEAQFCRDINQHHQDGLRRTCTERGGMTIEKPVLVGVDPYGADVRAMFDVLRIRFEKPVASLTDAHRALLGDRDRA